MAESAIELDHAARELDWEFAPECYERALRIVQDPQCTLATASFIFWAVQPMECVSRDLAKPLRKTARASQWAVVREIVRGVQAGRFQSGIEYDPSSEWQTDTVKTPAALLLPTDGEVPVVWRTRQEVRDWWPAQLENEIAAVSTAEDLFGIATLLDDVDGLRLVLESPHLDAGTALVTYWRLRRASKLWVAAHELAERAELLLREGSLPTEIHYDPSADAENSDLIQAPRWVIPDELRRPTQ